MPLLLPEPNLFPENLFEHEYQEDAKQRCWHVMHTRPRQEKSLAREMHRAGVPFYLPLLTRQCRVPGRTLHSHVPLFPGYVFLLACREERNIALSTKRVVHSLDVNDQPGLWHDLRQIQRLIASGAPITPEDRLRPGVLVEIQSGPLAGLRGQIIRAASGRRFVVQVDFIQKGASILLDEFNLAVTEENALRVG